MLLRLVLSISLAAPSADGHAGAASAAFERRDYEEAGAALRRAHALDPAPRYVYGQAQAARAGGDCTRAIELYTRFMALSDAPKARGDADAWIAECRDLLTAIDTAKAASNTGEHDQARRALAELGGSPASPELLLARARVEPADVECDAAEALVDAFQNEVPMSSRLEEARTELSQCGAGPPPPQPIFQKEPAPAPAPPRSQPQPRFAPLSLGLAGSGLVLGAGGGGLMAGARIGLRNAAEDDETLFTDDVRASRRLNAAGIAMISVGGALLVAGIVHHAVRRGRRKERQESP